ncbi:hypothetical protein ACQ4LE_009700 [Meloidogyne hapla]
MHCPYSCNISRHITQPYASEKANDNVIAVDSAIADLHAFISDLRRVTPIRQALRVSPSLAAFGLDTMRTEIDYKMEQYQIACKNLGGQKLDLLNFWKNNSKKFPHLATISMHFLAIPPSSTSCERIFSRFSPLVYDYKRNRFDPHTISTLISLQSLFKDA